ncbi:MAG: hypothetical protein A2142_05435 [candidate division Zixibacteria bacterium RBG_16_48_11]|nr:MAG: hypothetical protein A2142_05435 [candidate division Zixibacteria bacterium RBG_16_48_11]
MPDSIRKVDYFKIMVPNKRGEAAKILKALRDAGVNLLAFSGFPRDRRAQLDFIPEDTRAFAEAAKESGIRLGQKKSCFLIQGIDKPGAMADLLSRLAYARINVTALDGVSAGQGRYGAILWVKQTDIAKTAKVLRTT